jgi:hypothetical protein
MKQLNRLNHNPAMRIVSFFLLLAMLFNSCSSVRHWKRVAADANVTKEKKDIITPKVMAMFPPQHIFIPGRVEIKTDTVVDVEGMLELAGALDSVLAVCAEGATNKDSTRQAILSRFKPRIVRVIQRQVDTVQVPATGQLYALQDEIEGLGTQVAQLKGDKISLEAREGKLEAKANKWLWLFIAACVLLILSVVLHFKRR